MAARVRKIYILLGCFGVVLFITYLSLIETLHYKTRARVKRFVSSSCVQFAFLLMSIYTWTHLAELFDPVIESKRSGLDYVGPRYSGSSSRSLVPLLWRFWLLFNSISAHFAYTTFVFMIATEPYPLAILFFASFGYQLNLFTGLVLVQLCFLLLRIVCKYFGQHNLRVDSSRIKGLLAVTYAIVISVIAFITAHERPQIKEVSVPIKNLPQQLDGFTITFISDIHLGPTVGKTRFEGIIHTVNFLNSDIVVIGGDLVEAPVSDLAEAVEPISWLNSKYGVYFVTGNHEYYSIDVENWLKQLTSLGVTPLHNINVQIPATVPWSLCLAGVDDPTADLYKYADHGTRFDAALGSCDQTRPVILVAHQPNTAKRAVDTQYRTDLILSGHTHGGQLFPVTMAAYFLNHFYAGLYPVGKDTHVYVSMGTIHASLPMRFNTFSEITHITLTGKQYK